MKLSCLLLAVLGTVAASGDHEEEHEINLHGSGTTNPSKYFWKVMGRFEEEARDHLHLTYRAVGSSTGMYEFAGEGNNNVSFTDFGAGDIPMTQARYNQVTQGGARQMVHIPFVIGGIAIFHNVPSEYLGGASLHLTPCVLAKIFLGTITDWNHADITSLNPSMALPASGTAIKLGHRTYGSSSTSGVTEYASGACPSVWGSNATGSTITWPAGATAVLGSDGMASHIQNNQFSLGYIDAGHGHDLNLPEISLRNADGVYLTSREADIGNAATQAIAAGVLPTTGDLSFANVNLYNQNGSTTWPITMMSYMYVNKDLKPLGQSGLLLKAFIDYVLSDDGQTLAQEFSFVKVPEAIRAYNNITLSTLMLNSTATPYTFERKSVTQKGSGAGEYVISAKRQNFGEYERGLLQTQITALSSRIGSIEILPKTIQLYGSGTTNPSKLIWQVLDLFQAESPLPLTLSYRAVGSSTGQKEFLGADNNNISYTHFGAGDIPMSSSRYAYLNSTGRTMVHVPFVLGAIGIFHSVPAAMLGGAPLVLPPCLLAKIFSRQVTMWDHADILAVNPSLIYTIPLGTQIKVVHRVHGSSSTSGTTAYLDTATTAASCSSSWGLGSGSTITWPSGTFEAQGSGGMSDYLAANEYAIGYIDAGHGHSLNLEEVSLRNAAGTDLTSKQANISRAAAEALSAGIIPSDPTGDWSSVNFLNQNGADTWPICLMSYFYLPKDMTAMNQTGPLLKAMVKYILDTPALLSTFHFSPVPPTLYTYNVATLASVTTTSTAKDFTFETSSTTQVGTGAGMYVISGKRRSYGEYERGLFSTSITTLEAANTALTARVATLEAESKSSSCGGCEDGDIKMTAQVALVFAVLGFLLGMISFFKVFCASTTAKGGLSNPGDDYNPSISESKKSIALANV